LPGTGRGADQGEALDGYRDGARADAHARDDLDAEILHGGIEALLDDGLQAVDLVDEEHVPAPERGEDASQVSLAFERRAGGHARHRAHLVRDHVGQGGFAQARRPGEQHVIERSRSLLGRGDVDL
jgi:hypothetical protein